MKNLLTSEDNGGGSAKNSKEGSINGANLVGELVSHCELEEVFSRVL